MGINFGALTVYPSRGEVESEGYEGAPVLSVTFDANKSRISAVYL
jgi:hypothetical protein